MHRKEIERYDAFRLVITRPIAFRLLGEDHRSAPQVRIGFATKKKKEGSLA
jgi:hypothetical protein